MIVYGNNGNNEQTKNVRRKHVFSASSPPRLRASDSPDINGAERNLTSDSDRTGGLTQSSQHFDKTVSKTIGGERPSHLVRNCSWRRFNWQNISVRNAMNAVNRGRAKFLIFCGGPSTRSRSWYHCRHVFSSASRYVSLCSLAMIDMQKRDVGSA